MARSQTAWSNSTKTPDAWAVASRNATAWGNESNFPASYTYSDPTLTYNSSTRVYNYISAIPADQSNSRNPTTWNGATKNAVVWASELIPQTGYPYDSSAVYDSSYAYDFTVPGGNQSNNRNPTSWAVTV